MFGQEPAPEEGADDEDEPDGAAGVVVVLAAVVVVVGVVAAEELVAAFAITAPPPAIAPVATRAASARFILIGLTMVVLLSLGECLSASQKTTRGWENPEKSSRAS